MRVVSFRENTDTILLLPIFSQEVLANVMRAGCIYKILPLKVGYTQSDQKIARNLLVLIV